MRIFIRAALAAALGVPTIARAQSIQAADSLLSRGQLEKAESLYYAAVSARPRDPAARLALGRYLAARGARRVAATLLEESLQFGGAQRLVVPDLAALYQSIDDYRALLALASAQISAGERNRAVWLVQHPTRVLAPDTALTAVFHQTADAGYLGEMPARVNGVAIDAMIVPRGAGLLIADTNLIVQKLRRFPTPPGSAAFGPPSLAAVADSLGLGRLDVTNVPVTVAPVGGGYQMLIGIDLLGRFAPTFDPHISRVLLRPPGVVAAAADSANVFKTLLTRDDFKVRRNGTWTSGAEVARWLAGHQWTFDSRRGEIVVDP